MPSLNFTEAASLDDLRKEFVTDLRQRQKAAEAEARDGKSATDKAKANRVAAEMRVLAEYWETIYLGNPLRPPSQAVQAPAPGKVG